jgi:hypothetical protein
MLIIRRSVQANFVCTNDHFSLSFLCVLCDLCGSITFNFPFLFSFAVFVVTFFQCFPLTDAQSSAPDRTQDCSPSPSPHPSSEPARG